MKRVLLILADGFEEIEALGTVDILRRLGVDVLTASLKPGAVSGAHNINVAADVLLEDVYKEKFDAVILPGGMPGAANLDKDRYVDEILNDLDDGTIAAAICAAPFVFAKRGLLNGKTFTMYPGFDSELGGLEYTSRKAERDGNIVTGKGPGAVFDFAGAIAVSLGLAKECENLYKVMFID